MPSERNTEELPSGFTPCGDCGTPLPPDAIGCNRCGRNILAERAAGKVLAFTAAVVAVAILAIIWIVRP